LRCGENKVFVFFKKCLEAPPQLAVRRFGSSEIRTGQAQPFFDFTFECVFESIRVLAQPFAIAVRGILCAKIRNEISAGESRFGLLHYASH
jgi:hypothetical protein